MGTGLKTLPPPQKTANRAVSRLLTPVLCLQCFTSMTPDPWNWNAYLWPTWALGVVLRQCVLLPLRVVSGGASF